MSQYNHENQPDRSEILNRENVHIINSSIINEKLTQLRDTACGRRVFANEIAQIGYLLAYEALKDVPTQMDSIETPLCSTQGQTIIPCIAFVPIIRAGIGMVEKMPDLVQNAVVWHIGMKRDEITFQPELYATPHIPSDASSQDYICCIVDPMIATGGSILKTISLLYERGIYNIRVLGLIASPFGIQQILTQYPSMQIYVASLDDNLNARGYIVPGLGDAGDRLYGTV